MEINPNNINTKLIFRLTNFMISKTANTKDTPVVNPIKKLIILLLFILL